MSEEQQEQQQQQQQQQQQKQQQQQYKSPRNVNSSSNATISTSRKSNIYEMRNHDYVSRLVAATPPYLYSAPMGPNNFFSDMLRSLVAARNQENVRNLQLQQTAALVRRPRKRSWSQHRSFFRENDVKISEKPNTQLKNVSMESNTNERPLELTTNKPYLQQLANKNRKIEQGSNSKDQNSCKPSLALTKNNENDHIIESTELSIAEGGAVDTLIQSTPTAASLLSQDLVLPPPPPIWYPSLYAPYGVDPLHFFIDLRVSGHIYDRKKENVSPFTNADNGCNSVRSDETSNPSSINQGNSLSNKHRHGSAFTVPTPRSFDSKTIECLPSRTQCSDAINLSSSIAAEVTNKFQSYAKYYDFGESKENQPNISKCNANYMLQQLPRLYGQFAARDFFADSQNDIAAQTCTAADNSNSHDNDNKSEADCDADSDCRTSVENGNDNDGDVGSNCNRERDIDVEIVDSIKYRTDGDSSRCSSPDEMAVTHID
uniref:Uncharacterized protein n=1 Tax=Glossina austeni TaxID=7395 RepID=A0A1A9UGF2_GLOAU